MASCNPESCLRGIVVSHASSSRMVSFISALPHNQSCSLRTHPNNEVDPSKYRIQQWGSRLTNSNAVGYLIIDFNKTWSSKLYVFVGRHPQTYESMKKYPGSSFLSLNRVRTYTTFAFWISWYSPTFSNMRRKMLLLTTMPQCGRGSRWTALEVWAMCRRTRKG